MTEDEQTKPASGAAGASDADNPDEGAVPGGLTLAQQHIVELEDRLERLARRRAALADLAERRREQLESLKARNREVQALLAKLRRRPGVRAADRASRAARAIQGGGETTTREVLERIGVARRGWLQLRATLAAEAGFIDDVRRALPIAPVPSSLRVGIVIAGSPPDGPSSEGLRSSLARQSAAITEIRSADPLQASLADTIVGLPGDVILIVSAGLEPVEDTWLDRLLECMRISGAAIVGARIVHGRRPGPRLGPASEAADLTVRHHGISFEPGGGMPSPRLMDWGTKPGAVPSGAVEVPAVDSCLLIQRTTLDAIDGLAPTQALDVLDVDVCLRVRAGGGRIVVAGDVHLLHRGPVSAPTPSPAVADRLSGAWGPYIFREVLLDRLSRRGRWSSVPITAALASGDARRAGESGVAASDVALAGALRELGWHVRGPTDLGADEPRWDATDDVLVIMDADNSPAIDRSAAVRVAIVRGDIEGWLAQPWFDDLDVVLVAGEKLREAIERRSTRVATIATMTEAGQLARAVADAVAAWTAAPRFVLVLGAATWDRAATWGDSFFARALQRQLERRGAGTSVTVLDEVASPRAARADATIDLFGSGLRSTRPGQLNVLWVISHPDRVTTELCDRFDLLFAASRWFAEDLARRLGRPVMPLLQATDPERFHPDGSGPQHELLFVGNSRNVRRQILDDLAGTSRDLAVYGRDWSATLLDPRYLRGEWIPNDELGRYYSSAAIVLGDHWPDMRDEGFIANRIFDAAAAGAFVISDFLPELEAEFNGGVVAYRDADDLKSLVDRFLADPGARHDHAERARSAVLARHTFGHRADVIVREVSAAIADRRPRALAVSAGR